MKRINADNKIFQSQEFQKDKYKFFILLQKLSDKSLKLYSDEENYIVCGDEDSKYPTWIWTKDNFDASLLPEIESAIELFLQDRETRFTCKQELYNYLAKNNFDYLGDYYFEMGYLTCKETIKPKYSDGYMDKVNIDDKNILSNFIYEESREIVDSKDLTLGEAEKTFMKRFEGDTYYVWKNSNDEIVAQACYKIVDGNAKFAGVYTKPESRGKGYAANLIYALTNKLLEQGYHVSLYTDYKYIPSNKAYKNVGYVDNDVLINFSCSRENKKTR